MCFAVPHIVIKLGLKMFCELIYHFIICLSAMALSYCVTYVTEIFTDSLCTKPSPPSLVILWCKVLTFYISKLGYHLFLVQCL